MTLNKENFTSLVEYPDSESLESTLESKRKFLNRQCWSEFFTLFNQFDAPVSDLELEDGRIKIGSAASLKPAQMQQLRQLIEILVPWRKGPFELFGEKIESEWRSDLKWERVAPVIGEIENRRVADIGCGNGYYMLRMLEHDPKYVLGFDPSEKFYLTFQLIQKLIKDPRLAVELLSAEHLKLFPGHFNAVICMGVIYHQQSPLKLLQDIFRSLSKDGFLLLETMTIDKEGSYALFPNGRYGKARNVFFLPTIDCLNAWLTRVGFKKIKLIDQSVTDFSEQKSTKHAPFESLKDFLDPTDSSLTIEGYPMAKRSVVFARKLRS